MSKPTITSLAQQVDALRAELDETKAFLDEVALCTDVHVRRELKQVEAQNRARGAEREAKRRAEREARLQAVLRDHVVVEPALTFRGVAIETGSVFLTAAQARQCEGCDFVGSDDERPIALGFFVARDGHSFEPAADWAKRLKVDPVLARFVEEGTLVVRDATDQENRRIANDALISEDIAAQVPIMETAVS